MFCTQCGNQLNKNDLYCSKCGRKNDTNDTSSTSTTAKFVTNKCDSCGAVLKHLSPTRYLCEYCGSEYFASGDRTIAECKLTEKEIIDVFHKAAQYELQNKPYEELQCFLSVIDRASDNVMILVKTGRAYRRNNMHDKAVTYYEQAIRINPAYANAYTNLGAVYIFKNDFERAASNLKHAINLMNSNRLGYTNDDYAIAHSNYAIAIGKLGRLSEAEQNIKIAEQNGYTNGKNARKLIGIKTGFWGSFL